MSNKTFIVKVRSFFEHVWYKTTVSRLLKQRYKQTPYIYTDYSLQMSHPIKL